MEYVIFEQNKNEKMGIFSEFDGTVAISCFRALFVFSAIHANRRSHFDGRGVSMEASLEIDDDEKYFSVYTGFCCATLY